MSLSLAVTSRYQVGRHPQCHRGTCRDNSQITTSARTGLLSGHIFPSQLVPRGVLSVVLGAALIAFPTCTVQATRQEISAIFGSLLIFLTLLLLGKENSPYLLHHRYRRLQVAFRPNTLHGSDDGHDLRSAHYAVGVLKARSLVSSAWGGVCRSSTRTDDFAVHHRRDDWSILFGFTNDARCHHCNLHFAALHPFNDLHEKLRRRGRYPP